jgi:hypothetical protein
MTVEFDEDSVKLTIKGKRNNKDSYHNLKRTALFQFDLKVEEIVIGIMKCLVVLTKDSF